MELSDVTIRLAQISDVPLAAAAHIESCTDIYRGMVDEAYLNGEMQQNLHHIWAAEQLENGDFIVIADDGERALGLVTVRAGEPAYIDHFHVRPGLRGAGLGRRMMRLAVEEMRRRGVAATYLTVLAVNEGAIAFYRRIGGEVGERVTGDLFGRPSDALVVRWPDISATEI